ncbi:MAG: hypothetical protein HY706_14470 [Candidatus Hydrogenedentes bacterium]|nr:hypothetical protein [Candidatus Hydrogenedentota bacterium]
MEKRVLSALVIMGSLGALIVLGVAAKGKSDPCEGIGNPALLARISEFIDSHGDATQTKPLTEEILKSKRIKFQEDTANWAQVQDASKEEIIVQLIVHGVLANKSGFTLEDSMIEQLTQQASKQALVEALSPYLESDCVTVNKEVREHVSRLLSAPTGDSSSPWALDSNVIGNILRTSTNPPIGLTMWLYEHSPDDTISRLCQYFMKNPDEVQRILGSVTKLRSGIGPTGDDIKARFSPVLDETEIASLHELSADSRWRVRLYVAALLSRYWGLRYPDIVDTLLVDESDAVRNMLSRVPHSEGICCQGCWNLQRFNSVRKRLGGSRIKGHSPYRSR